jgi:hypothetical protein
MIPQPHAAPETPSGPPLNMKRPIVVDKSCRRGSNIYRKSPAYNYKNKYFTVSSLFTGIRRHLSQLNSDFPHGIAQYSLSNP